MYTLALSYGEVSVITYAKSFLTYLLQLALFIVGILTITILMKKRANFSTFEKQLLSLLILKCVYELISAVVVS